MISFLFIYLGIVSLVRAHISEVLPFLLFSWALHAALEVGPGMRSDQCLLSFQMQP